MKNVLVHHGWQEDHIKVLIGKDATKANIFQALNWMDRMDDQDDIALFVVRSHGSINGGFAAYDGLIWGWDLDPYLDELDSKGIAVIISACYGASIIPYIEKDRRVILTSCEKDEESYVVHELMNSVFSYFLVDETGVCSKKHGWPTPREGKDGAFARESCDTNNDGWVSAEEAFNYVKKWTLKYMSQWDIVQTPVMSDNYDGELLITQLK